MENVLLQATNLSIGYLQHKNPISIAEQLSFTLCKGKLIALVGANGIGKSTLIRTLTGLQKPLSGKIFIEGNNLHDLDQLTLAQQLSVVLTDALPPSNLTVFELIALGRQPYTNWLGKLTLTDVQKINEALELTQIQHLAQKKHYEISDGQLQIVLIARALAQDTPLIILDEPTTHLDLLHKVLLLKLLKKLTQETDKCILFSTHDIDMAIQICDEMIVMSPQKVVQDQPCNLIMQGEFDLLFPDEELSFDTEKGKFVIKNQ